MKVWRALIVLGVFALASGGALVILNQHRTIGLAGIGLGALLLIFGSGGSLLGRKATRADQRQTSVNSGPRSGIRRGAAALLIVLFVGVATFYGANFLAGSVPGPSPSTHSTITHQTSGQTGTVSSGLVTFTGTKTFILSTSTSTIYTGTSSEATTGVWSFSLVRVPSVTVVNNEAYLNVSYSSSLNSSVRVYEKITLFHGSSGSNVGSVLLTIPPRGGMNLNLDLGTLSPGSYSVFFNVVDNDTGAQISESSRIDFSF